MSICHSAPIAVILLLAAISTGCVINVSTVPPETLELIEAVSREGTGPIRVASFQDHTPKKSGKTAQRTRNAPIPKTAAPARLLPQPEMKLVETRGPRAEQKKYGRTAQLRKRAHGHLLHEETTHQRPTLLSWGLRRKETRQANHPKHRVSRSNIVKSQLDSEVWVHNSGGKPDQSMPGAFPVATAETSFFGTPEETIVHHRPRRLQSQEAITQAGRKKASASFPDPIEFEENFHPPVLLTSHEEAQSTGRRDLQWQMPVRIPDNPDQSMNSGDRGRKMVHSHNRVTIVRAEIYSTGGTVFHHQERPANKPQFQNVDRERDVPNIILAPPTGKDWFEQERIPLHKRDTEKVLPASAEFPDTVTGGSVWQH